MYRIQTLNGAWELFDESHKLLCTGNVPGSVINDLLDHNLIEDPYWRCNEYEVCRWMEQDYSYSRSFVVFDEDLKMDCAELVCEGLDTIAAIYINDTLAARTSDMHRMFRIDVKKYLLCGENRICIKFDSPVRFVRDEDASNDIFYASTGCMHGNAALRKAHYMFGWDWGPQLPDAGIFRDIRLEYSDSARIEDVFIRQYHEPDGQVSLRINTQIRRFTDEERHLLLEVQVIDPQNKMLIHTIYPVEDSFFEVMIESPELWWPNGLGAHPLYKVQVKLVDNSKKEHDSYSCRIGLRTVTVSTDKNEYGNEFAITVNGIKIFTMGANYIPEDNILKRVTKERSAKLIRDCAAANFNCLRIWGGGYYPDDYFYDICDEEGILIWQDLMFGCNVYALNDSFEENIVAETKDIVRRLRHHACLALWCGNNEMEWGWADEWARLKGHHPRYKADYTKIFEYILPKVIRANDKDTFYWPSSPSSGGSFDDPNATNRGDQHYWEVWHSGKPFTEYGDFSFCSEYGFQSFPHMKTIESFTLPEDRNIFSRVMESHQKNGGANGKILGYVADYFLYPKDMDSLAYISQILQLKAIEYGVEHWRRKRGRCMGSLYWQLNDCWPVASWASIDYYGRWKALHYGARRFYAPFTISLCEEEELSPCVAGFLHNDTLEKRRGRVEMLLMDRRFQTLWSRETEIELEPLTVAEVLSMDFSQWTVDEAVRSSVYVVLRLYDGDVLLTERVALFVKPKHFMFEKPVYNITVTEKEMCFEITVKASGFCQYAELYFKHYDPVFTDNYMDITNKAGVAVCVNKGDLPDGISAEVLKQDLIVRSVADSYSF